MPISVLVTNILLQEAADAEYQRGIKELQRCLCRGKTLDELWAVANGDVAYEDFKADFIDAEGIGGGAPRAAQNGAGAEAAVAAPPPPTSGRQEQTESAAQEEEEEQVRCCTLDWSVWFSAGF